MTATTDKANLREMIEAIDREHPPRPLNPAELLPYLDGIADALRFAADRGADAEAKVPDLRARLLAVADAAREAHGHIARSLDAAG